MKNNNYENKSMRQNREEVARFLSEIMPLVEREREAQSWAVETEKRFFLKRAIYDSVLEKVLEGKSEREKVLAARGIERIWIDRMYQEENCEVLNLCNGFSITVLPARRRSFWGFFGRR